MTNKLTPGIKGLITGIAMVAAGLILHANNTPEASPLQYTAYFLYGLGIVWSVTSFAKEKGGMVKFGELFNQGFKCFVVVSLVMAVFTIIFYKSNAHVIDERAAITKQALLKTEKNRTPKEIDEMVENGKKYFIPMVTSIAVFQYLLVGAIVAAATAGTLSLRQKN